MFTGLVEKEDTFCTYLNNMICMEGSFVHTSSYLYFAQNFKLLNTVNLIILITSKQQVNKNDKQQRIMNLLHTISTESKIFNIAQYFHILRSTTVRRNAHICTIINVKWSKSSIPLSDCRISLHYINSEISDNRYLVTNYYQVRMSYLYRSNNDKITGTPV